MSTDSKADGLSDNQLDELIAEHFSNIDYDEVVFRNFARDAIAAHEAQRVKVEPVAVDPMDWPLPCDVIVGHGTMRKGVALRSLVSRMKVLYEMATGNNADAVESRTPEQRAALQDEFLKALESPQAEKAPSAQAVAPSPTCGMNMAQRIMHVGGRNPPGSTYVEFGSIQAVEALVHQVLRDQPAAPAVPENACDTPHYCRGVQRCTAMDSKRATPQPPAIPEGREPLTSEDADMLWDEDDGDNGGGCIEDIIANYDVGAIITLQCAKTLPNIRVRVLPPNGDGEYLQYEILEDAAAPKGQP